MARFQFYNSPAVPVVTKCIKAAPGTIRSMRVTNANAAVRWLLIHEKATDPVATDVPLRSFLLPGGTAGIPGVTVLDMVNAFPDGQMMKTGIAFSISTTAAAFTNAATAAEHVIDITYI